MNTVHIVGAGGIGCAVGYALRKAGVDVLMVETDPTKIKIGRANGITIAGQPALPAQFVPFSDWSPPDEVLVLLCTKCYDNAAVLEKLPASTRLVPIQNGFDPQLDAFGHVAEAIASFVSECSDNEPCTRITRPGDLHIGGRGKAAPDWLSDLAQALGAAKLFRVVSVPDILPFKNTKLLYNAAISPLAAASGIDNGELLRDPLARRLFFAYLRENYEILVGANMPLGIVGPFHPKTVQRILKHRWLARLLARAFEPGLRGTYCSMSGDLPKGQTEIANYNGRLVEIAVDGPCPLNRRAVEIIGRMERERIAPNRGVLEWFAE